MLRYAKPESLEAALTLLAEAPWRVLAGGTDFYPPLGAREPRENVLDINGLAELRGIAATASGIAIGARTTWTEIIRADLPPAFDALKQAAREIGSVQIQNMATVAGNLCNASPAADGVPALMILDAEVELRSAAARRLLPLGEFILGNRRTARRPDELLTAIRIPHAGVAGRSRFEKLGARRYLVISIAMAAARIELDSSGRIEMAAVAVGACSAVAARLGALEASLIGERRAPGLAGIVAAADLGALSPIDDVRGSAAYRRQAARELVLRAVAAAAGAPDIAAAAA